MEKEIEKIRRTQIIDHDQLQKDHDELHHSHQVSKHLEVFQTPVHTEKLASRYNTIINETLISVSNCF